MKSNVNSNSNLKIRYQLEVQNLTVSYGLIQVVKGISFHLKQGEIAALIGCNGAGKTSTLKAISGLLNHGGQVLLSSSTTGKDSLQYGGDLQLDGIDFDLSTLDAVARLKMKISLCPEGRGIFPNLTVIENLLLGAYLEKSKSVRAGLMDQQFGMFPRLAERKNQVAGTLSGGEQQMLAIARSLMSQPEFLLLDEPSLGLAPVIIEDIFKKFDDLKSAGLGILLVEQNAHLALEVADQAFVLETGTISCRGTGASLRNDPQVIASYLS